MDNVLMVFGGPRTLVPSTLFLLVGFAQPSAATPILVSATASSYFTLTVPCNDTHSSSGPSQVSVSSACAGAGNHSEAVASASFQSLASNSLSINASSTDTTGGNIYTDSTADWLTWLVVRGGTGSGFIDVTYFSSGTISAGPGDSICEVLAGSLPAQPCGSFGGSAAFTFDQPFSYFTQLHVRTIADIFDVQPPPEIRVTSVNWSIAVKNIQVVDVLGRPISGATVEVVPEPWSAALVAAGLSLNYVLIKARARRAQRRVPLGHTPILVRGWVSHTRSAESLSLRKT